MLTNLKYHENVAWIAWGCASFSGYIVSVIRQISIKIIDNYDHILIHFFHWSLDLEKNKNCSVCYGYTCNFLTSTNELLVKVLCITYFYSVSINNNDERRDMRINRVGPELPIYFLPCCCMLSGMICPGCVLVCTTLSSSALLSVMI
jgi:hypothetical protein